MEGLAQQVIEETDADRVAGALKQAAGELLQEIELNLPRALAGDQRQVHAYVNAYRQLVDRVLEAIGETKALGEKGVKAPWLKTALEQGAMSAPFTDWVSRLGIGEGVGVAFVASMRQALPGAKPLTSDASRRPPGWDLDTPDLLRFYRAVMAELERAVMPLERVQAILGLSRTELAALFGVRRQALDQWETRGVPAERQEKLATIGEIADLLGAKLKRDRVPGVIRRPGPAYGGRSILEAIAAGDQDLALAELRDAFDWGAAA